MPALVEYSSSNILGTAAVACSKHPNMDSAKAHFFLRGTFKHKSLQSIFVNPFKQPEVAALSAGSQAMKQCLKSWRSSLEGPTYTIPEYIQYTIRHYNGVWAHAALSADYTRVWPPVPISPKLPTRIPKLPLNKHPRRPRVAATCRGSSSDCCSAASRSNPLIPLNGGTRQPPSKADLQKYRITMRIPHQQTAPHVSSGFSREAPNIFIAFR